MAVGVLALQGSFNEHMAALRKVGAKGVEIRKPEQLETVHSLIIPGGESTTISSCSGFLISTPFAPTFRSAAIFNQMFPALRDFVNAGKPVWGTCAGLIFLADKAIGHKSGGGQEFVGGLDCTVHRNFFGSQLQSFETELSVPQLAEKDNRGSQGKVIVALRHGNILAAAFHPELTSDTRWHSFFLKRSLKRACSASLYLRWTCMIIKGKRPYHLPIFE